MDGYKCFNKDRTNRYGKQFVEGETYTTPSDIGFGNDRRGYHMCKNLSDVFRFFDVKSGNFSVASVTGIGECVSSGEEDYYGYSDMYSFKSIKINKFLTREEIIEEMLKYKSSYLLQHFFSTFVLTEEEKVLFARKFRKDWQVMKHLLYYQFGFKGAYEVDRCRIDDEELKKVMENGQNSNQRSKGK